MSCSTSRHASTTAPRKFSGNVFATLIYSQKKRTQLHTHINAHDRTKRRSIRVVGRHPRHGDRLHEAQRKHPSVVGTQQRQLSMAWSHIHIEMGFRVWTFSYIINIGCYCAGTKRRFGSFCSLFFQPRNDFVYKAIPTWCSALSSSIAALTILLAW